MGNDMIINLKKFTINSLNFESFPIKISQEKENLNINHESRIRMSFHIVLLYSITLPSHILNDSKDYKNILEVSRSTVETKSDEIIGKITRSILKKIDSVT